MKLNRFALCPTLALALLTTHALAAEPETVWLSSLDLSPIVQGWGQPQADKAVTGKPLSIGGKKFERGLGTHAASLVRLLLKGGSEKFSAFVGVDDAAGSDQARISFRVIGDGKTLFKSGPMKLGQPAKRCSSRARVRSLSANRTKWPSSSRPSPHARRASMGRASSASIRGIRCYSRSRRRATAR